MNISLSLAVTVILLLSFAYFALKQCVKERADEDSKKRKPDETALKE